MGFKVVILWEDTSTKQFFLKDGDEVKEVFGRVVADIVYLIRRYGESVFTVLFLGGVLHDANNTFYNIVYISEVAFAVSVVEDFDGFAFHQFIGKAEVGHVGATGGTIDGEKAKAGRGDVVEFRVGMGHQLIAFLGSCIETDRVVYFIIG